MGRTVISDLAAKREKVAPNDDWQVYYAFFARSGFTEAARTEAKRYGTMLIDLAQLDADLG